jgi:hypothetical protein
VVTVGGDKGYRENKHQLPHGVQIKILWNTNSVLIQSNIVVLKCHVFISTQWSTNGAF